MRASCHDVLDLTLYAPMRDGPGEAGFVGLYADWRDLTLSADVATATVVGVALDVAWKLRMRRWAPFNALRKSEAIIINFQPLDAAPRGSRGAGPDKGARGFTQLGEELWRIDEDLTPAMREDQAQWVNQKLSITIEQQDEETWWLLLSCGIDSHPPPWMRRFVKGFEDAFWALLTDPLQAVHRAYPDEMY